MTDPRAADPRVCSTCGRPIQQPHACAEPRGYDDTIELVVAGENDFSGGFQPSSTASLVEYWPLSEK